METVTLSTVGSLIENQIKTIVIPACQRDFFFLQHPGVFLTTERIDLIVGDQVAFEVYGDRVKVATITEVESHRFSKRGDIDDLKFGVNRYKYHYSEGPVTIKLCGFKVKLDSEDVERVRKRKWYYRPKGKLFLARRTKAEGKIKNMTLQTFLLYQNNVRVYTTNPFDYRKQTLIVRKKKGVQ